MTLALVEDRPAFNLAIRGWDRTFDGKSTDEKIFEYEGLRFETEIEGTEVAHSAVITLRILQDGVEILKHQCNSIWIRSLDDSKILIEWSRGAMGKNHGTFSIIPGWKIGGSSEHVPDVNF